jgi:peptidoglycan/xylan/chitin deacetylase (PgdA/CDA1 family)
MSDYCEKLLELLSIEKESDKYALHIRFFFEQDTEIYLEIDEYTAKYLELAVQLEDKYKYRLSFTSSWDTIQKKHTSIVTRTIREQSSAISFPCSEDYIGKITTLKNCKHIDDLDKTIYLFIKSKLQEDQTTCDKSYEEREEKLDGELEQLAKEEHLLEKYIHRFLKQSTAVISSAILLSLVLLSCAFISRDAFDPKVQAHVKQSDEITRKKDSLNTNAVNMESDLHSEDLIDSLEAVIKQDMPDKNIHTDTKSYPDAGTEKYPSIENDLNIKNLHAADLPAAPYLELSEEVTYSLPERNVALTFDDGPSQYTTEIVDMLKKYRVGGTFFFIGRNVSAYPDSVEYVQRNGYSIGSHSMNHKNMAALSYDEQENELLQSMKLIENITHEEVFLFRAPFGSFDGQVEDLVHKHQYKMVLWNNDPKDWKSRDADQIFHNIKNTELSGSIILMHESRAVVDVLPRVIEYIQEQGLKITSLR